LKAKNTEVKIEAHGHLGGFSETYYLRPGQEWLTAARAMREFLSYVRKGWEERMAELFKALDELEKIEKKEAEH